MTTRRFLMPGVVLALIVTSLPLNAQTPLGTAFTYQGQLKENGQPIDETADFQLSLWNAESGGSQVGATLAVNNYTITDGLFTMLLDFGTGAFTGQARWLEVAVRSPAGSGGFTTLAPRQSVAPTPYALALPAFRTEHDTTSPRVIGGWDGNSVTDGAIGTTISGGGSSDVGGGASPNRVTDNYGTVGGGTGNRAGDDDTVLDDVTHATVGGGHANTASGTNSTVAGGRSNNATGGSAVVGGGYGNSATSLYNTIAGGLDNQTSSGRTTIGGGRNNVASAESATVSGGLYNTADGLAATIPGGRDNSALGDYAFAAGRNAHADTNGSFVWNDSTDVPFTSTASNQFLIRATGGVGIGTASPATELDVAGTVKMTGFQLITSPSDGHVLTCDASGTATWQPPGEFTLPFTGTGSALGGWAMDITNTAALGGGGIYGEGVGSGVQGVATSTIGESYGVRGEAPLQLGYAGYFVGRGYFSSAVGIGTDSPLCKLHVVGADNNGSVASVRIESGTQNMLLDGNEIDSDSANGLYLNHNSAVDVILATGGGNVGIGTDSPGTRLEVAGTTTTEVLTITGGSDLAERFDVAGNAWPGMVVAIDADNPGKLCIAEGRYNRRVAGVISGANELNAGMILADLPDAKNSQPVALTGRVWTYCDATERAIEPGDLLTTAELAGHAMAVDDHARAQGAVIGKAMSRLARGEKGLVLVLVNLQ